MSGRNFFYIFVFLLFSLIFPKSMFYGNGVDGFYSQINFIDNNLQPTGLLWFIHFARYIVVWPFWFLYKLNAPVFFQSIVLLLYMLPFLISRNGKWKYFILLSPLFFSYRTALVILSISILYHYFLGVYKGKGRLFYALLLANLSSGVLIPFMLILYFIRKSIGINGKLFFAVATLLVLSVLPSISHKIYYFTEGVEADKNAIALNSEYDLVCDQNLICTMLKRSNIYSSYIIGNYGKTAFYTFFVLSTLILSLYSMARRDKTYCFFLTSFLGVVFEGLWVVSFFFVVLSYILDILRRVRFV
ncbi:hypothetical protein [Endozoicomonas sp. 4G]|uniref:hypothetical protein n=1 Tax=Endozoicomonas sp. 4G TaxID=2872754 RepID=UPI0020786DF9|nr:hypothetical protein [Endozoicomonas sp. 4G]